MTTAMNISFSGIRTLKLMQIIEALKSGRWTVRELAQEFKCTEQTIARDLQIIKDCGFELKSMTELRYSINPDEAKTEKRNKIIHLVAKEFDTTPQVMRGPVRLRRICEARRVYSYIARTILHDSFPVISISIGKDHKSVIEQVQKMEDHIFLKDEVARKFRKIETELSTKQII